MKKFFRVFVIFVAFLSAVKCQSFDDQLMFEQFYGSAFDPQMQIYDIRSFQNIVNHPHFNPNAPTVIFHFDQFETNRDQQVVAIISAYLYMMEYNVILVDYQNVDIISDDAALDLAHSVAHGLEGFLRHYNPQLVHFLGNGVGANVMSHAAEILSGAGITVSRLTGLNPTRISHHASFTDTIHTEETNFNPNYVGQASFFINGGTHPQPRCTGIVSCSRDFSKRVWSESILSETPNFPALPCSSWINFLNGECNQNVPIGNAGLHAHRLLRGSYFLQTNTREPWSRQTALPGTPAN
ncbi:inactive pancreatic lipase-related protein 1-like [Chironomus tepperi]|uniref:inactive pancreatic lipase-related protein 1-like n=1 Tax=Chironomus tepperi TaxID=113505 RepID=UPI00391FA6CB